MTALILILAALAADEFTTADAALAAGDYDAAAAAYRALLEKDAASGRARMGLARALTFSGRREEAIAEYSTLLAAQPENADALLARGRVLAWEGRHAESQADLRRVVQAHPDYADAWAALADTLRWSGDAAGALEACDSWQRAAPDRPEPHLVRSQVLQDLDRFDEARAELEAARAAGAAPGDVDDRVAALARAPGALPWEAGVRYTVRTFEHTRTPWQEIHATLGRKFDFGSVTLDAVTVRRFSRWDSAVAADAYIDTWKSAYVNLRLQHADTPELLPRWDAMAELSQGVGSGWEVSAMYRRILFPGSATDVYGGSIGKYLGSWYLRTRVTAVPSGGTTNMSGSVWARRYFGRNDEHFVELGVGRGESTIETGVAQRIVKRHTFFAELRGETELSTRWGFTWGVGLHRESDVPDAWTFSSGLKFRW